VEEKGGLLLAVIHK